MTTPEGDSPGEGTLVANMLTVPMRVYFTRLPDDERMLDKVIVGVLVRGANKVFARGAWSADAWDAMKAAPWWNVPHPMLVNVYAEEPGLVLRCSFPAPLTLVPREAWPAVEEGEAWKGRPEPATDAAMWWPIGTLVRARGKFKYGGEVPMEPQSILVAAIEGRTKEPVEQVLDL